MRFDGVELAHGWLAVAAAAGTDKKIPALYRTVVIEHYDSEDAAGMLLYATDRFVLLKAWIPEVDGCAPPTLDTWPDRVIVASDTDKRANSLLGYVLSLASREGDDYVHGQVEVRVDFDQRLPAGSDPQASLDGMAPTYVVLSVPDVERVYLEVVEAQAPDWRSLVFDHVSEYTDHLTLGAEIVERLAKVRRHASGRLSWAFGGADRPALVEFTDSDPHVSGVVMPIRDDGTATATTRPASNDCAACTDPSRMCLLHASGVITAADLDGDTDLDGDADADLDDEADDPPP